MRHIEKKSMDCVYIKDGKIFTEEEFILDEDQNPCVKSLLGRGNDDKLEKEFTVIV